MTEMQIGEYYIAFYIKQTDNSSYIYIASKRCFRKNNASIFCDRRVMY